MDEYEKDDVKQSLIRTVVPIVVGAVMASVVGPYVDESALRDLLSGLIAAGYYATVRVIELRVPNAGLLLGSRRQPMYW
jgi:hypothetical protein